MITNLHFRLKLSYFLIEVRYRLCVAFVDLRYHIRMVALRLGNLRVCRHQLLLYYKLMLQYLLDKRRCFTVLDSRNQLTEQNRDLRNGFESGHGDAAYFISRL